ncbi:hypothetical protein KRR38_04740 [Novosphingobium sp. G106]|uniref:hypothetical protein n=1 Tax=Novosphingobium sp. G106 TaxID=2849500 RepID=UPI001C2D40D4|nr:hypothetical protein [Novosphingobium sp. G106]MBV1686998.1 hypothetical protein [Novosphingobium sp. G106]
MPDRRQILRGASALGLGSAFLGGVAWSKENAAVRTILPSVTSDTVAVKVLLDKPAAAAPVLTLDRRPVTAQRIDTDGYAWGFVQGGLAAGTRYTLELKDEHGAALREPWPLRTFPAPDAAPEHARILFFTCAGGDEAAEYLPLAVRRALLDRALSFQPDLAVANGDHVYWDQWTGLKYVGSDAKHAKNRELYERIAWIAEDQAFDPDANRRSINTVVGRQIAGLYEDRFASVPLFFITDDHDYFENDNAGTWGYAFPPRDFVLNLQRRVAAMAYPFALGRPNLPAWPAETLETARYGKLIELALFDCRRGWSVDGNGVLFPEVEALLIEQLRKSTAQQLVHVPSNPFGWSKGALGEWYADGPPGFTPAGR